jgi:hypothetical protein
MGLLRSGVDGAQPIFSARICRHNYGSGAVSEDAAVWRAEFHDGAPGDADATVVDAVSPAFAFGAGPSTSAHPDAIRNLRARHVSASPNLTPDDSWRGCFLVERSTLRRQQPAAVEKPAPCVDP